MKFKIFGQNIPVYKEKGLTSKTGHLGEYHYDKMILIDSQLVGDEYRVTLVHEFLEAAWHRSSFGLAVNNELKEVIIDQISKALVENFKITPKK